MSPTNLANLIVIGKSAKYTCPKGGCDHPNLNGPRLLQEIKAAVKRVINAEADEFYNRLVDKQNRTGTAIMR